MDISIPAHGTCRLEVTVDLCHPLRRCVEPPQVSTSMGLTLLVSSLSKISGRRIMEIGCAGNNLLFEPSRAFHGLFSISLEENGNEVNSSRSVHVTEARKPIVEFEGVGIGSLEITNRGEATVTCLASHGRPEGSFQWFMGKEV